ncbi:MAG: DegT/DnrJ/EryC1/StrS family aminotransferase [Clostridium sp.]|uniref:DegT/DnrJ/EryC1/StrS family aminotransferase n=1 Tax=Clostridium sp. TaxID=1506 RepID=UPI002A765BA7|nr:DegT/DnrJ/EryC1/StrS family aminotransferase [Clostridium sp.]MDY2630699.1 DegT/DnrJ/EryC1/StrS family aminotransferase [Clostridium sp.]
MNNTKVNKPILVTKSSMPPFEEYIEEIKLMWENKWLTNMGVKHQELELKLKEYLEVNDISLFTNGHLALELALQAMNLTGEIITTPFTFASTTHAIVRNGLTPVFCDINDEDYTMDVNKIEALITDKTSAILPVHVYGSICNVEEIQRIADKYNLKVIYDAAHAFGEKYKGTSIANFGDISMFSFHATKVFNTIEGGAITFSDNRLKNQLYKLKNFGIESEEVVDSVGSNAKMNEFQASMGICNLRHIDEEIKKRKKAVDNYRIILGNVDGIKLIKEKTDIDYNYSYFPILFDEKIFGATRNEVYNKLKENNIFSRKYFYPLANAYDCYRGKFDINDTPVALSVSKRILTLPLYADITIEEIGKICDIIMELKR